MYSFLRLFARTRWARYGTAVILLILAGVSLAGAFAAAPNSRASNYAAAAVFAIFAIVAAAAGKFLPVAATGRQPQRPAGQRSYGTSVVGTRDPSQGADNR